MTPPPAILVNATNWAQLGPVICEKVSKADFVGLDYETQDDGRHAGLDARCGYDPITRKKGGGKTKPLIFDMRRTVICGMSVYSENMEESYYIDVGHKDDSLRLPYHALRQVQASITDGYFIAHNAAFELAVTKACLGVDISSKMIDTLQMCVSSYTPDQYSKASWLNCGIGEISKLVPALMAGSVSGITDPDKMTFTPALTDLVQKVISKTSSAGHSYNGLVKSISYGYGLKKAVASHFNHKMTTFEEVLGNHAHMGQLSGAEVCEYGAADAYWAVRLFRHLLTIMPPSAVECFFSQENPMAPVFADIKLGGMKVNADAIVKQQGTERASAAVALRKLRSSLKGLLPFEVKPCEALLKYESWYVKNHEKYRKLITTWVDRGDAATDFEELKAVRGPVSKEWTGGDSAGPNFTHYMPVRVILYDLLGLKPLISEGTVDSDGGARGKLLMHAKGFAEQAITSLNALASIEQRVKLYITPYGQMIDPDTSRMYPTVTSMLATRRMAASDPNGMQLAKRGESAFVRSYFIPDGPDDVLVSLDWSAIELVEIGEFSGDPEFIKAFGQIPHDDLHAGAAADLLKVEIEGIDVTAFKKLPQHQGWGDFADDVGLKLENLKRLQTNFKGNLMAPKGAYGFWRTELGKGANFNYWYSGWLATIGERMGWSMDTTKQATDLYRMRFPVAEAWRVALIAQGQRDGFITLPDGNRYTRYEATMEWMNEWVNKFVSPYDYRPELDNFRRLVRWMGRKIAKRAGNQDVNAMIQGSCATIAKRSILSIIGAKVPTVRFIQPNHDELIFSVNRYEAPAFIEVAHAHMTNHLDLFKLCKLDASPSVGLNFSSWDREKSRLGQVELYEPPKDIVGAERAGKRLDKSGYKEVIDWLFEERDR